MRGLKEEVISKIKRFPENRIFELIDFIDFLAGREEIEGWKETEEILKNKELMKAIRQAEKDIRAGKIYHWENIKKK